MESSVRTADEHGVRVVTASGAIGGAGDERLGSELREAVAAGLPVALDLTGVTELDSGAAEAIRDAQRDAADRGSAFVVAIDAAAAYELRGSANLAGLLDTVPRTATRDAAVAAAAGD